MNIGPNQEKWLTALESGKYEQGVAKLCFDNKYCCLGVAAEIFGCEVKIKDYLNDDGNFVEGKTFDGDIGLAPSLVLNTLKLYSNIGSNKDDELDSLVGFNDDQRYSFSQIANIIREKPEAYFSTPN